MLISLLLILVVYTVKDISVRIPCVLSSCLRFGFGISGLYKSELVLFSLSLAVCIVKDTVSRIPLISSCFVLRFALTYWRRVNVPKSVSCFKLDDFFTPDFGCLYLERYCFSYSLYLVLFCFTLCVDVLTESVPKSVSCFKLDDQLS